MTAGDGEQYVTTTHGVQWYTDIPSPRSFSATVLAVFVTVHIRCPGETAHAQESRQHNVAVVDEMVDERLFVKDRPDF